MAALAALIIRIYLSQITSLTSYGDLLTFKAWGIFLFDNGPQHFYSKIWSDYLPGYLYVMWGVSWLGHWLSSLSINLSDEFLYKLPSIITDILNAWVIYLLIQQFASKKKALITSCFALFNPAALANSTFWGQADSFVTFYLLSSFYFLTKGEYYLASLLIALGQTVKPIAIFVAPIYLFFLLVNRVRIQKIMLMGAIAALVMIIYFLPFSDRNIFQFILDRHLQTSNQYPYTTVNAINFWSLVTKFWESDQQVFLGLTLHNWGTILFSIVYLALLALVFLGLKRVKNQTLFLSFALAIVYLAMYIFLTRMHERHLFYGMSFTILLLPVLPKIGLILSATIFPLYIFNLYFAFSQINKGSLSIDQSMFTFLSILSLIILFNIIRVFIKKFFTGNGI